MPQTLTIGAVLTAEELAERLAETATQALIDEARLSPKPGLVDSRSSGAHQDLTLDLMVRSARSLTSTFYLLALHSWQRPADIALRQEVGRLGRAGEAQMMAETGGVNTHRGAIWAMGLLVSAVAMQPEALLPQTIAQRAAKIAALPDAFSPKNSVKVRTPCSVIRCRVPVKKHKVVFRTLLSGRCRSSITAGHAVRAKAKHRSMPYWR